MVRLWASKRSRTAILYLLKFCGVFAFLRAKNRRNVRILCYHGIWLMRDAFAGDSMFMLPATFELRLAALRRLKFNVISLPEAVAGLRGERSLPGDSVVITIDDGWYGTFVQMLPALKRYGFPATIYCDTENIDSNIPVPHVMARYIRKIHAGDRKLSARANDSFIRAIDQCLDRNARYSAALTFADELNINMSAYISCRAFAYMTQAELYEAHRDGFDVELHTHHHTLAAFHWDEVAAEIRLNREALSLFLRKYPQDFRHFCYPSGKTTASVGEMLRRLGIESATTLDIRIASADDDPLLLPRLIDGNQLSAIEFEAELCGIGDFARHVRKRLERTAKPARR